MRWVILAAVMGAAKWITDTILSDVHAIVNNKGAVPFVVLAVVATVFGAAAWLTSYIFLQMDVEKVKSEATSQGRTFIEHLGKIFPDDIMEFCAENRGKETALAKGLGKYRKEKRIDKLDVACLKEAFRHPDQSAGGNLSHQ